MIKEGQIVLFKFPQTDQTLGVLRPALVIRKLSNNYDDWLICMVSKQLTQKIENFDDIINLIYALPSKYRRNAKFLVNNANIRELRKLKDSQNRYIWQDAVAPGQPATVYGYPIIENNWVPESEIYFGDYKLAYWLGDRQKMAVTVSREAGNAWERDQVGIRVVERLAGNCVLENAVRLLNQIP